jgi:hypothetical protein
MKRMKLTARNREYAKEQIDRAPDGYVVEIKEPNRNLEQNSKLHAMISDISKQVEWMGMSFKPEIWKRLLTASFLRDSGEKPMLIPALDGSGVDIIYEKTSNMGVRMIRDFIEWIYAFGAEHQVVWSEKVRDYDYRN